MAKPSKLFSEIIEGLPRQPLNAVVVVADRVNDRIIRGPANAATEADHVAIMTFLDRFAERFGLGIKFPGPKEGTTTYQRLQLYIQTIRSLGINAIEEELSDEIDDIIGNYEGISHVSFGLARLNAEEKKRILEHLERAREVIESSDLSDRKKNALFGRLADLIREVSAHGTRTDRFFSFAGDLGFVIGEMTEKGKPLFHEVKEILKIVTRSRAREEGISLPSGDEVLKIPPPSDYEVGGE